MHDRTLLGYYCVENRETTCELHLMQYWLAARPKGLRFSVCQQRATIQLIVLFPEINPCSVSE